MGSDPLEPPFASIRVAEDKSVATIDYFATKLVEKLIHPEDGKLGVLKVNDVFIVPRA